MGKKKTLHQRKEDVRNLRKEYQRWTLKEIAKIAAKERMEIALIKCHSRFCMSMPGMSFIDMAHLEKNAIHNNKLCYYHLKTKKWIEVTLTKEMIDIISFITPFTKNSSYLFPILFDAGQHSINECLKKSRQHLTHIARHDDWKALTERREIPPPDSSDGLNE